MRGLATIARRLTNPRHRRRCVLCGYSGIFVQAGGAATRFECPCCGGDLYARPARSYNQMEGFDPTDPAATRLPGRTQRALHRILRAALAMALWLRPGLFEAPRARPGGASPAARRSTRHRGVPPAARRGGRPEDQRGPGGA